MIPILYEDDRCVVVDKPRTFHVHPPETRDDKVPRSKILLYVLRDQLNSWMYPVHRLDVGTTGVLIMAKDSEAASLLSKEFQKKEVEKIYWSVVRGFVPDEGVIDVPLQSDSSGEMIPCLTSYRTLARTEIQQPVGKRFPTARYSWVEARLGSGRFHQIRRHFNRISHPVIGDAQHGDSHHNRYFRESVGVRGLCLRAIRLKFFCPWKNEELRLEAPVDSQWSQIQDLFAKQSHPPFSIQLK